MDSVSFAGYLWSKHFRQMHIYIMCEGENRFPSVNINARDVLLYNDYDKFINMVLPAEEVKDATLINVTQAGCVGISAIELMKKLFSYAVEIESELKERKLQNVVKVVYENYQKKLQEFIKEASESFKEACNYIAMNAVENISEVQDSKDIFCECTAQIEKKFFELVKENEIQEILQLLDGVMEKFCQYVDTSGAVR